VQTREEEDSSDTCVHISGAKTSDFSKFKVSPHGQRGLSQCGHFADKEESIFCDFVQASFMDIKTTNLK